MFEDFHPPPHPAPPALFSPYLNFVSSSLFFSSVFFISCQVLSA
uniref:Uncharacterized protein n=1 Tax=Podoviridae sp. cttxo15 TaxID=2826584 RepID=A0A8S5N1I6_9CAUD|nr:MAG TPA: hypothetical protein [Podoviridae sp. cttxo15]